MFNCFSIFCANQTDECVERSADLFQGLLHATGFVLLFPFGFVQKYVQQEIQG